MTKNLFLWELSILHILNDGFSSLLLILLPFIAKEMNLSLTQVGVLGGVSSVLEFFLAMPSAYLSRVWGGRKILTSALVLYGLGYLLTGFSTVYGLLLVSFLIAGAGFALFHPIAFALVSRLSPKNKLGEIMGNFTAMGDVGRIAVSSFGAYLVSQIGFRMFSFISAFIVFILTTLYILIGGKINYSTSVIKKANNIGGKNFLKTVLERNFILMSACHFFDSFASSSLFVFIPFVFLARGISAELLGIVTSTFFVGNMAGKLVIGRMIDVFGNKNVFIFSELLMFILVLVVARIPDLYIIIITSVLLGVFTKGTVPILSAMVPEVVTESHYEKSYGFTLLLNGIAKTIAPVLFGYISDMSSVFVALQVIGIFALLAAVFAFGMKHSKTYSAAMAEHV